MKERLRCAVQCGYEPGAEQRAHGGPLCSQHVDLGVEESMDGGVAQPTVDVDAGDGGTARPPDAGIPDGGLRVARASPPVFAARARAIPTDDPGRRRLQLSETRDLPGAFGDPFRAVDALPGIVPVASGLSYFYFQRSSFRI